MLPGGGAWSQATVLASASFNVALLIELLSESAAGLSGRETAANTGERGGVR